MIPFDPNKFLEDLARQPAPEKKPKDPEPAKKGYRAREEEKAKIRSSWKPQDHAVDAKKLALRTELKRVVFNESGITEAIDQIARLPEPGEAIHMIMGGHFNGFDILPAVSRMAKAPIRDLHIATLGFNIGNNRQLCQMIDDGLIQGRTTLIASEVFAKMDGRVFAEAKENLESRGGRLANTRNHAKIIACRIGEAYLVTEGSGNLRSCSALEQLTIMNSQPVHDFHVAWINQVADAGDTRQPTE